VSGETLIIVWGKGTPLQVRVVGSECAALLTSTKTMPSDSYLRMASLVGLWPQSYASGTMGLSETYYLPKKIRWPRCKNLRMVPG